MTVLIILTIAATLVAHYFGPGLVAMTARGLSRRLVRNPAIVSCGDYFPFAYRLEAEWREIRAEFDDARTRLAPLPSLHVIDPLQRRVATHGGVVWPVQILKIYGLEAPAAAERFPLVSRLIADEPRIVTAMFSLLPAGKTIPTHKGLFRGVWRYHLCLRAPQSGPSFLRIGGDEHHWREGESLLFDDTYPHSAHNLAEEERLVLFLDIVRTDTPRIVRDIDAFWLRLARNSWRARAALRRANAHARRLVGPHQP